MSGTEKNNRPAKIQPKKVFFCPYSLPLQRSSKIIEFEEKQKQLNKTEADSKNSLNDDPRKKGFKW